MPNSEIKLLIFEIASLTSCARAASMRDCNSARSTFNSEYFFINFPKYVGGNRVRRAVSTYIPRTALQPVRPKIRRNRACPPIGQIQVVIDRTACVRIAVHVDPTKHPTVAFRQEFVELFFCTGRQFSSVELEIRVASQVEVFELDRCGDRRSVHARLGRQSAALECQRARIIRVSEPRSLLDRPNDLVVTDFASVVLADSRTFHESMAFDTIGRHAVLRINLVRIEGRTRCTRTSREYQGQRQRR